MDLTTIRGTAVAIRLHARPHTYCRDMGDDSLWLRCASKVDNSIRAPSPVGEARLQISGRLSVRGDKMPRYGEIAILLIGEDTMIEDLYDLIGGQNIIEAATKIFYDKVSQDDNLRHFFEKVDMTDLRSRQSMFVSMLLAGRVYTGKNIRDAHAGSRDCGLTDAHFDLFLQHFRAALEEVGVKPENAEIIMKRLESKRGTILDT